jgi:hypothetical protein
MIGVDKDKMRLFDVELYSYQAPKPNSPNVVALNKKKVDLSSMK